MSAHLEFRWTVGGAGTQRPDTRGASSHRHQTHRAHAGTMARAVWRARQVGHAEVVRAWASEPSDWGGSTVVVDVAAAGGHGAIHRRGALVLRHSERRLRCAAARWPVRADQAGHLLCAPAQHNVLPRVARRVLLLLLLLLPAATAAAAAAAAAQWPRRACWQTSRHRRSAIRADGDPLGRRRAVCRHQLWGRALSEWCTRVGCRLFWRQRVDCASDNLG